MVRGMAIGVLVLSFFSWFWLTGGLDLLAPANAGIWKTGISLLIGALAACGLYGIMRNRTGSGGMGKRERRIFNLVNAAQWVAIFAAIAILNVVHRPEMIPWVASMIVGLHFFPLASVFRWRGYWGVGFAILGVDLLAFLWAAPARYGVAMLGTGTVLVLCAMGMVVGILRISARERRVSPLQPAS